MLRFFRFHQTRRARRTRSPESKVRTRLHLQSLDQRIVPATNLILDFDGGALTTGQGYIFPSGFGSGVGGNTYSAWPGFTAANPPSPEVRTQQILQIVAAVREDYADFDVNVIWDDRGANSPFFTGVDTVVMIVGDDGGGGLFGIAPSVDLTMQNREVALAFGPAHEGLTPDTTARSIRELIDTISHEAGHTFGLSHTIEADAERRQIVTVAPQNTNLDSRFSSQPLNHSSPEPGVVYAERDRLQQNLGLAPPGTTLISMEAATGQALIQDTTLTGVSDPDTLTSLTGAIDFGGDRDAFRIQFGTAGTYTIVLRANASNIAPVVTLWTINGDFISLGSTGSAGGFSLITFDAAAGQTIFVIAGTAFDQLGSGEIGTPTIGAYLVDIGPFVPPPPPPPPISGTMVVGTDYNGLPQVRVFDLNTGVVVREFLAYNVRFRGGVRVAYADVNGDGTPDIITAPGRGGGPHIRVFNGRTFQQLLSPIGNFMAYDVNFTGGVYVAAGDVNGDGFADVITGAGAGGGPHVRVFSGLTGAVLGEFMAYDPAFAGGVTVAVGDTNGDGFADVITGAGVGGGPHVMVFSGAALDTAIASFFAYTPAFRGGIYVAAGDVNGDGKMDIITGAGAGGGPHIRVFDGSNGLPLVSFFALSTIPGSTLYVGDSNYLGGVRIAARDVDGDGKADIFVTPGTGGRPKARIFNNSGSTLFRTIDVYDSAFLGGVFVS